MRGYETFALTLLSKMFLEIRAIGYQFSYTVSPSADAAAATKQPLFGSYCLKWDEGVVMVITHIPHIPSAVFEWLA